MADRPADCCCSGFPKRQPDWSCLSRVLVSEKVHLRLGSSHTHKAPSFSSSAIDTFRISGSCRRSVGWPVYDDDKLRPFIIVSVSAHFSPQLARQKCGRTRVRARARSSDPSMQCIRRRSDCAIENIKSPRDSFFVISVSMLQSAHHNFDTSGGRHLFSSRNILLLLLLLLPPQSLPTARGKSQTPSGVEGSQQFGRRAWPASRMAGELMAGLLSGCMLPAS